MLTEVAGQMQYIAALLKVVSDAPVLHIEAGCPEAVFERIARSLPFPCAHKAGELRRRLLIEAKGFADFPRSGKSTTSKLFKRRDLRCVAQSS
jgi:hypothetical protein